jgi:hypothetical protein
METSEKAYLKNLASEVRKGLITEGLAQPFSLAKKVILRDVDSGGWAATIGNFRGHNCSIEIWFDRFTSHSLKKIYYVIYSKNKEKITELVHLSKPLMGQHISVKLSDWLEDSDISQLKVPLMKKQFGVPIFEKYPQKDRNEYFYGIYVYERTGLQRNENKRLVDRIVQFVRTINDALAKEKLKQETDDYRGVENRKSVQRHIQRERRSHLATLRKQKDNYVCQVCGFHYPQKYGLLGDDFSEAHHIVPLAKNDKQRTSTIKDLITVCANCHRMLHRMKGKASDIATLMKIVKKKK